MILMIEKQCDYTGCLYNDDGYCVYEQKDLKLPQYRACEGNYWEYEE